MPNRAPAFEIRINDKPISKKLNANVVDITLKESLKDTAKLTIIFKGHSDFDLDKDELKFGTDISIKLGYVGDLVEIFRGEIFEIKPIFTHKKSELTLTCLDRSYILKRVPVPRIYEKDVYPNLLSIVNYIMSKYSFKVIVSPSEKLLNYKLNDDQGIEQASDTDWAMLHILSRTGNQRLFMRDRTVYMVDDAYISKNLAIDELTFHQKPTKEQLATGLVLPLLNFTPKAGGTGQREKVKIITWASYKKNPKFESETDQVDKEGGEGYTEIKIQSDTIETLIIENVILSPGDDAQARALVKSELQRRADLLVKGKGMIIGNPRVRVGDRHGIVLKELGNIGRQFTGTWTVTDTKHNYSKRGYFTNIEVRRPSLTS